jgi:hypothetical protein
MNICMHFLNPLCVYDIKRTCSFDHFVANSIITITVLMSRVYN